MKLKQSNGLPFKEKNYYVFYANVSLYTFFSYTRFSFRQQVCFV